MSPGADSPDFTRRDPDDLAFTARTLASIAPHADTAPETLAFLGKLATKASVANEGTFTVSQWAKAGKGQ